MAGLSLSSIFGRSPISQNDLYALDDQMTAAVREINQQLPDNYPAINDRQLQNPYLTEKPHMTTIGEQLKAARDEIAEARKGASDAVADTADATRVVLGEVAKLKKEADDLRAEVAELTNGGPA